MSVFLKSVSYLKLLQKSLVRIPFQTVDCDSKFWNVDACITTTACVAIFILSCITFYCRIWIDQNLLIILLLLTLSCDFDFWWVFLEVLRRMMILVPSVCWKCWKGRACWNVKMAAKIVYIIIAYQSVCTTVDVTWNIRFISPLVLLVFFF